MIHIRSASEKDADAIADIWNYYISETTVTFNSVEKTNDIVKEAIKACDRDNRAFWWLRMAGICWAFALIFNSGAYRLCQNHGAYDLNPPSGKRRGDRRALMERLCAHAKAGGVKSLFGLGSVRIILQVLHFMNGLDFPLSRGCHRLASSLTVGSI